MTPLIIPHRSLAADTLTAMLEDFVTRNSAEADGATRSLLSRVEQVRRHLDSGKAVIVYDAETETFGIVSSEQATAGL